ncbi:unnamed protein product [Urochloa decumbens]|uniref:Rx N-terminal domain-containing protein n=1 Tax=Urochloa decumbens TaxID=240449 RepID=A0ABC9B309_9POAL
MDAQGALDSFLGRLTTVLSNEAQLLSGVRSDVEFIKDEMESMNSLILQLTDAQHRDHLVRSWMKQVVGLTRDCEGNVELYVHYVVGSQPDGGGGLLGYLRGAVRFVRTVTVRHRIATRIQELKVRARDVGDRRQRYGVTVPESAPPGTDSTDFDVEPSGNEEDRRLRRAVLIDSAEQPPLEDVEVVRKGIETLLMWMAGQQPASDAAAATTARDDDGEPQVKVFSIIGRDLADEVAKVVFQLNSEDSSFGCKALVDVSYVGNARSTLAKILEEIAGVQPDQQDERLSKQGEHSSETLSVNEEEEQLAIKLQRHLKGKRFLIAIKQVHRVQHEWKRILGVLLQAAVGCHPGSAIILTTPYHQVALSSSPYKIIDATSQGVLNFYIVNAGKLVAVLKYLEHDNDDRMKTIGSIFDKLHNRQSVFAMKLFLHLLYVNPKRRQDELKMFSNSISDCTRLNKSIEQKMVMLCYNELPSKYRSCLLYLTIYPKDHIIRTTSLARRWIAEGLTPTTSTNDENESAANGAEHYLEVLFAGGFVSPVEISAAGDIKSFRVHHEVHKFISRSARDVNFVDANLPQDLAHHLSIHNRIELQKNNSYGDSKDIVASLPSLAASPQWQLLKVMDLDGCRGLEKHHLKKICKILLLKYLSLRNTDVTELPKQIKELQCLETLDIRQTGVRVLAKKPIVLPLLKHLLSGDMVSTTSGSSKSEESIATVSMPLCIQRMKNMEILSHVKVTDSGSQLCGIAQLLKLRKFGVALHGKDAKLHDLFQHIEKLDTCLCSLSIQVDQTAADENNDAGSVETFTPPKFIKSLNIKGLTTGLPQLIKELHQLVKLTLAETYLKEDDLRILGKLGALRCLRLLHKSYTQSELTIKNDEFQRLNYLLVEGNNITKISFVNGAAPKLEWIVWSSGRFDALFGIDHLSMLKKLKVNNECIMLHN